MFDLRPTGNRWERRISYRGNGFDPVALVPRAGMGTDLRRLGERAELAVAKTRCPGTMLSFFLPLRQTVLLQMTASHGAGQG